MKTIKGYQIIDHGFENSQYFQGCGVSFTSFTDCFTGIGGNPFEALEDAMEMAAQSGWNTESIDNALLDSSEMPDAGLTHDDYDDCYHYVSIRVK